MKYIAILFFLSSTLISSFAQNAPIDFETNGNGASWTWAVFENDTNPPLEIIANPDASGINTSATVAKFTALQSGQPFAGCESMHGADIGSFTIGSSNNSIKIMVWKSVISDVGIKLVEPSSGSLGEIKVANTLTNQWEELTFDFSSHIGNVVYDQIVIFPDFAARTADNVVYFDNISFAPTVQLAAPTVAAPVPTIAPSNVISLFSNAYTDVPVSSWRTSWSMATYTEVQIAGDDTKKYEDLDFVGIETVDANLIDASAMQYFNIDIWTPNITSLKIKLVDFGGDGAFGGGDDSEHEIIYDNLVQNTWVSYQIPFSDFTGLSSTSHLAQLILSGLPTAKGTVYVDNIFYSSLPTSVSEPMAKAFELFPNPALDQINLRSNGNMEKIEIFNLDGKRVMDKLVSGTTGSLDIAHLPKGAYTVVVTSDEGVNSQRFIKI